MGILRRLADRLDPPEKRDVMSSDPALGRFLGGIDVIGGQAVNSRTSEGLSTVLACVNAISTSIASLPAFVFQTSEAGRAVDRQHPMSGLIKRGPNEHQGWPDFVEWLMASTLLRGNGLAEVVRDPRGRPAALIPIRWETVSIQMLPSGRLAYDVSGMSPFGSAGPRRRLLQSEVLHLRDRTDDGLVGRSRLHRASQVVGSALSIQEFSASLYANGINPSGVLELEGKANEESVAALRSQFSEAFTGSSNAAKSLILDQGAKWKQISINPEDAELLASRRFSVEELARIYNVPPPLIGDLSHGTFTNSETAGRWFATHTLAPWVAKLEAAIVRQVFSESDQRTHELEIDMSGFLRGDPATRWKGHQIAVQNGILTPNEVRLAEGWNPHQDGNDLARTTPSPEGASSADAKRVPE